MLAGLVDETEPERWRERRDYADQAVAAATAADDDAVTLEVTLATSYMTALNMSPGSPYKRRLPGTSPSVVTIPSLSRARLASMELSD